VDVEIVNWEKYNPRKDIKHPRWFAFDNRMLEASQFFEFSADELKAWIYLLCQASQRSNPVVRVSFEHAERVCGVKKRYFLEALKKLEANQCVRLSVRDANESVRDPNATLHTLHTEQDTTEQDSSAAHAGRTPIHFPDASLRKEIWESYANAYFDRYKTEPVRNGKVNSQIKQLAERLGSEAVDVVRFYVSHNKTFYVSKCHEIGLCLADAESLRTQWVKGKAITNSELKRFESAVASNELDRMIEEGKI
jgi:hypothetical protein